MLKSLVVGAVATALDLLVLRLLVQGGLSPTAANVPSLLLGVAVQFLGNKYWAFGDASRRMLPQSALFAAVEAGTFALNAVAFHGLVAWAEVPYVVARPCATFSVYALFSYPLWSRIFVTARAAPRARGCPPR